MSMERLTYEADFGLEDWEETLFFVKSDPNGAYNILDIAKYQGENEFYEILKNIALRLSEIENILGDTYDLERLQELVEADKDGRCVVLPCEVCDTVYILNKVFDGKEIKNTIEKRIVDKFIINRLKNTFYESSKPFVLHFNLCDFGKTVFLNREAAEVALAKEADHE